MKTPYGHVGNMKVQSALAYACNVSGTGKFWLLKIALVDLHHILACLTAVL